jgi:hypothetical protein
VKKENILLNVVGLLLKALLSRITHTFVNGKLVYNAFKVKIYEQEKIVV